MDQITLAEAARTVFLTIAPLIAGGALAKIGEDITGTVQDSLGKAWDAIEQRFKRKLSDAEKRTLVETAVTVEQRLASRPRAAGALAYFRGDPDERTAQQIVEAQIVDVFQPDPDTLRNLAQAVAALQPQPTQQDSRTVTVNDQAQVGTIIQGDVTGDLTFGPIDFSRKTFISGGASSPSPAAPATPPTPRDPLPAILSADGVHFSYGHALVIGVGDYRDPRIADVPAAATDARRLAELLRDRQIAAYPAAQVQLLTDREATRTGILAALDALAARLAGTSNATALIFFAGHGESVGESYALLPSDAWLRNLAETAVTAEVFHERIATIRARAKRLVVLLNCCHAGGVGDQVLSAEEAGTSGSAPPPTFYRPLAVGSGQVVISSSRPNQKSGAISQIDRHHSTFGLHLLNALRGQAPGSGPGLGVFELFAHLRTAVPPDARAIWDTNGPLVQEPLFYASQLDDNIAVALRPTAGSSATLSAGTPDRITRLVELERRIAASEEPVPDTVIAERDRLLGALGV